MRRCAPQPEAPVHRMIEDRDPCTGPLMHPSLEAPVVEQSHAKHAAHPVKNAAGQNIAAVAAASDARSEEHTSELQSLMRISYAVFCLKKKNTKTPLNYEQTHLKNP